MQAGSLSGGFRAEPQDAARAFRQIMRAMACPGEILPVVGAEPPAPLSPAAAIVVLTLCDPEAPLFLSPSVNTQAVRAWITFHTGAPLVTASEAMFALGRWDELPKADLPIGTAEFPDRSATMIVEMSELTNQGAKLSGPGIEVNTSLSLPETEFFQRNRGLFPLGLDVILTAGGHLAGVPRSTEVA